MSASTVTDKDYTGFYSSSAAQKAKAEKEAVKSGKVSHNDFLKLLTTQLTTQDPLNPMQDIDFTAQLAQLQALDEQMAMTKSMTAMRLDTQLQAGSNMIGKYVSGTDKNGTAAAGLVSRVLQKDGSVYLELANKQQVEVASVTDLWNDSSSMSQDIINSGGIIGMWVNAGYDEAMQPIEGIVEKVVITNGIVTMKLYGGKTISWNQIKELRTPTEEEAMYILPDDIRTQLTEARGMVGKVVTGTTDDGKEVTGLVGNAGIEGTDVYVLLYSGEKVKIGNVGAARDAKASDVAKAMDKMHVKGLDTDSKDVAGVVVAAKDTDSGILLILADGKEVYWDALTEIRKATADELAAAEEAFNKGKDDDSGGSGTGGTEGDSEG